MDGAHALCAILHQIFRSFRTSGLIRGAFKSYDLDDLNFTEKFPDLWQILVECAKPTGAGESFASSMP